MSELTAYCPIRCLSRRPGSGRACLTGAPATSVELFERAQALPEAWHRLTADRPWMSFEWLAAFERAAPQARPRYGLLRQDGVLLGAALWQVAPMSALGGRGKWLGRRMLVAGNSFSSGQHGLVVAPNVDPERAFEALAWANRRVARRVGARAVLVKDFAGPIMPAAARLEARGYHAFEVDPRMVLHTRSFGRFEDYLQALRSKYRQRVRAIRKKGAALDRQLLGAAGIRAEAEAIEALFAQVSFKAKLNLLAPDAEYFASLAEHLRGFRFVAYRHEGRLVGFRTELACGDSMEAHYLGLDYAANKAHRLYENMLYDHVERAIDGGYARLDLGRTAMEMKSNLGAVPERLHLYARHANPLLDLLVERGLETLEVEDWTARAPFKGV